MKLYLCGPISGCSDVECKTWREEAKLSFPEAIDPMRRDYRGREGDFTSEIVELDKLDIMACDAVLVYLDRYSAGTIMEILFAWEQHRPVIIINKMPPGHKLSPWITYHAHEIVDSFDKACEVLDGFDV